MNEENTRYRRLHYELIRSLVDKCSIPTNEELLARMACTERELDLAYQHLADEHGVVLHPNSSRVWAIHPFSLAPTPFLIESGQKKWWGNCAWCSLGIAALLEAPSVITTTLGAEGEQVQLSIQNDQVNPSEFVVHFPIPMKHAWDNVVYTCSTMLLFRNPAQVFEWSMRHRIPLGDIQPVAKVFELAKRWYGEHLLPDWQKKSLGEARTIFQDLGLAHPVWALPASQDGRF